MKVAILGPVYPYRGGIAHYTMSLAKALGDAGHQVSIYNFTRQYPKFLFPGKTQEDRSESRFSAPSKRTIDSMNPWTWWTTARQVAVEGPDVLLIQWWHPYFAPSFGSIARLVRRRSKSTKVVFLCHNVRPHESSFADRALLRYAYGIGQAFVVQADREEVRLRALLSSSVPIAVAKHPVYDVFSSQSEPAGRADVRADLGIDATTPTVLFFGYVRRYKGLDILLDALAQAESSPHLIVAGEFYDEQQPYLTQIERLGLSDRVSIVDRYLANEDVPGFFAAADVVVIPYREATQSGIVQVAYAFGLPVIVTEVGGIPEVVERDVTGLLVPPEDPTALAAAIDRFFAEDMSAQLRRGIADYRARGGWETVVEAICDCVARSS